MKVIGAFRVSHQRLEVDTPDTFDSHQGIPLDSALGRSVHGKEVRLSFVPDHRLHLASPGYTDGLLLWLVTASHKRFRVKPPQCQGVVLVRTPCWGAAAVCIVQAACGTASVVFEIAKTSSDGSRKLSTEVYRLDIPTGAVICDQLSSTLR